MNLPSRITLGLLCAGLSLNSAAQKAPPTNGNPFVGLNLSLAEVHYDVLDTETSVGRGFTLGLLYPDSRVYATLDFYGWRDAEATVIRANYDRVWSLHSHVSAFAGVNGSLMDLELAEQYNPKKFDTGPGLGVQAGLTFHVTNRWAIESGVRWDRFWVSSNVRVEGLGVNEIAVRTTALGYVNLSYISW